MLSFLKTWVNFYFLYSGHGLAWKAFVDNYVKKEKIDIAIEHLDLAIEQVTADKNFYSAIHLAGAAEEILGKYIERCSAGAHKAHHEQMLDALERLSKLHVFREEEVFKRKENSKYLRRSIHNVKHMDNNKNDEGYVTFDAKQEAIEAVEAGLSNFMLLISLDNKHHSVKRAFTKPMLKWFGFYNANLMNCSLDS
jgi:hypothetical protein